jgi:anaerobic selenocysteine-containing dehydrogenase
MAMKNLQRRDFLRVLGWGGASASVAACGYTSVDSGVETVKSYVEPEDFNVPGVGIYYASTCTQCEAACGVIGRVRDGRVLKLEGNAASGINKGKLCGLGQASVQHHYNPDRLKGPLLREGGTLRPVSLGEAQAALAQRLGAAKDGRFAFLTGPLSGHLRVLVSATTESFGAGSRHYTYDPLANRVNRVACERVFGTDSPRYALDQAQLIVSFGADFLDTWLSPVHFAGQYARFRRGNNGRPRGTLVQIEPRMTLTGANADRWVGIRPGTEGVLALGLANALLAGKPHGAQVPGPIATAAAAFDKARVLSDTGVGEEAFDRLVRLLQERSPSVVLSGPSAEGHAHGLANAQAILALNWVRGNVGKTVLMPAKLPFPNVAHDGGDTASLGQLAKDLDSGRIDTLFVHDVNPVYSAPGFLKFADAFAKAQFKVVFAQYKDETAMAADLVLPVDSALEDWGTHLAAYQPEGIELNLQQPLMERLYADTRSVGDTLLELLKRRRAAEYKGFADYYAYLRAALVANRRAFAPFSGDDEAFWTDALSRGVLQVAAAEAHAPAKPGAIELDFAGAQAGADAQFPLRLAPAVRSGMRDGRHANLPWMQETPDSLTTIVWGSWAEVHPATAKKLGISDGDVLEIASASGTIRAPAYVFPGLHPDVIGVPLGQGHETMGRYADANGVNPLRVLDPVFDKATGELAMYGTRIKVSRTGERSTLVKDEGWKSGTLKTQGGRKLVVTLSAEKAKLADEV